MEELPEGVIDLLMPKEDTADSGMHRPNDQVSGWDVPNMADDNELEEDDDDDIRKEALGLTDIPAGRIGGDVLGNPGVPQPPGLSREEGDDEETDLFGAKELIEPDESIPSKNHKYKTEKPNNENDGELNFLDYLFQEAGKMAYLKHVYNLKIALSSLGLNKESSKAGSLIRMAQDIESVIATYIQSKTALENAARRNAVKMDYDVGFLTGEVSFLFENGRWTYDHSIAPDIGGNPTVDDIASGKVDPTFWGGSAIMPGSGMSPQYRKLIMGLSAGHSKDVAGGVIYLYNNRGTGTFDATFPQEIPSTFYSSYEEAARMLGATSFEDLESKVEEFMKPSVPEQPTVAEEPTVIEDSAPIAKQEEVTWENHEYGLSSIKEPWEAYASRENLDSSLNGFLAWHDANYKELGIPTKDKVLAFLSGAAGEKKSTQMPEPGSSMPIAQPISKQEDSTGTKSTPVEEVLETTIREILDGKALGRETDNKMEKFLERAGGSKEDLKPLIDQIIMQTKPADLLEMLQDPERKYRAVLRQARKATRRKLLGEG
jgi:hypothetical protein